MLRAFYLFIFGIIVTIASLACAQEKSIDSALQISRRTGKPIFAIASRRVCNPCRLLKSRVANMIRNSGTGEKVVYLNVDIDNSSEWQSWNKKFSYSGKMLPIVYLIRADQRQMYGRNNTLPGDQLEKFLSQGVEVCGKSLSNQEIQQLESANKVIEKSLVEKDVSTAARWMRTCSHLADSGKINSYAVSAIRHNQLSDQVAKASVEHVKNRIDSIQKRLKEDPSSQFHAIYDFVTLERIFGEMKTVSDSLSSVAIQLAIDKELRGMWNTARRLYDINEVLAENVSGSKAEKALKDLREIEKSSEVAAVRSTAKKIKTRLESSVASREVSEKTK